MKLTDFLSSLKTKNVMVTITDLEDNEIAKIYASSYAALDDSLEARKIYRWTITGATSISVILKDAEDAESDIGQGGSEDVDDGE